MNTATHSGQYALATGANAVGRLDVLHSIYSSTGRIGLIEAGLKVGMTAADFGCGSGTMTRLLAAMVGPSIPGSEYGIPTSMMSQPDSTNAVIAEIDVGTSG